jgi:hypothetical protein
MFDIFFNRVAFIGFTAIIFCSVQIHALAQITQTTRYEREFKSNDDAYTIIDLKNEGIGLIRSKHKFSGNKKLWEFTRLDTALQENFAFEFYVEERYPLIGYEVTPGSVYLLYRTGETSKNHFLLIQLSTIDKSELLRHEIKPELDFRVTHFSQVGSNMVLGGYVSNDPAVILFSTIDKSIKVVPGFFIDDSELVDLRVNQNRTFNVVLIDKSAKTDNKVVFRTFDESGNLLLEDVIPLDPDRSMQHCLSSSLQREELMLMGTWSDRQAKQASGFFAVPIDPFNQQTIRYYQLGELNHFVDYLNAKRAAKIKEKSAEDVKEGRKPSFSAFVIPYEIIEHNEGFLMLAEVYNPVNNQNPYSPNSPYGNPYYPSPYYGYNPFWPSYYPGMRYRPTSLFDPNTKNESEIKTYETVLLSFDGSGKLLWDQSMKLDDIEKKSLDQISDFCYINNRLIFLSKKESEVKAKLISIDNNESTEIISKIKGKNLNDEIRHEIENESGVKHAHGNAFYVWGYQTIRNMDFKEDRTRDVFYINKVVVR